MRPFYDNIRSSGNGIGIVSIALHSGVGNRIDRKQIVRKLITLSVESAIQDFPGFLIFRRQKEDA